MNKDKANSDTAIRVYTPKEVRTALENLPSNYVIKAQEVLQRRLNKGEIERPYSDRYICKVKANPKKSFNKDVMDALVEVGLTNLEIKSSYGVN